MNIFKRLYIGIIKLFSRKGYKGAEKGRLYGKWIVNNNSPNANLEQYPTLRQRANDLYVNNPFINGAINTLVNRIVGAGTTPQARTKNNDFNTQVEQAFKRWSESADVYGQYHFGDMERVIIQKLFLDGGIFIKTNLDNRRKNPFCLELLEYSRLATYGATPQGRNVVIQGVEINPSNGTVVAYHFVPAIIDDTTFNHRPVRIPVSNIIHFSPFRRPGQILGIPLLTPAIPYAYNLGEIVEAELISKKVEASLSVFVKTGDVYSHIQAASENQTTSEREIEIAPGMINYLEPGEDIQILDPNRPGKNFKDFTYFILEGIARSLGMSLEQITGDKSQVNYSSARHSELELRDYIKPFRKAIERYFLNPIWRQFISYAVMSGVLKVKDFMSNQEEYEKVEWIFKGDDWVDPVKEINAKANEILLGVSTLSEVCAAKGKDWQEVAKQRAREKEFLNNLGLNDISQETQIKDTIRSLEVIDGGKAQSNGR